MMVLYPNLCFNEVCYKRTTLFITHRWKKCEYGKCCKISNTLLFFLSNKILVIRTGINKIPVRVANREANFTLKLLLFFTFEYIL